MDVGPCAPPLCDLLHPIVIKISACRKLSSHLTRARLAEQYYGVIKPNRPHGQKRTTPCDLKEGLPVEKMNSDRPSNLFAVTIWCHSEPVWSWPAKCPFGITYMKGQIEEGASAKRHYQFYLRTNDRIRRTGVKKLLGCHHAHVEACYKNEIANENYCSKSNTAVAKCPDLIFSVLENKAVHPVDYLMEPHVQLVYGCYPEAKDCGEAIAILLTEPARFTDRNKFLDWKSQPSLHSSNCRCMDRH